MRMGKHGHIDQEAGYRVQLKGYPVDQSETFLS